ncbi:acetyl-CoA synthetase-like protein [Sistotremastrum niveocremeum HHB9708]|uniref:Acetyl-CoA synthetase-like protein n=1 Tax=Sistotremastrum niveocremeum HHB9708 TaxID=1314777 RepID=A0A165A2B6_9AGAM|nr:acetyl-CoA synthetase-like protein [Sistotremastrum niveocremeum HHB9708]
MIFTAPGPTYHDAPDDISLAQFMLDVDHPYRPLRKAASPWLIDNHTGVAWSAEDIRSRVHGLANSLKLGWPLKEDDVACIYSPNHMEYPIAIWACHRLGMIVSPANPNYTTEELVYQLQATNARILFTHPDSLPEAKTAAQIVGLEHTSIILLEDLPPRDISHGHPVVDQLVKQGLDKPPLYVQAPLRPGEGRTKLALLCFSSGTTGKPKAVALPHFAIISCILQMSLSQNVNNPNSENQRYRSGDMAIGVLPFFHIYGLVANVNWAIFCGMSVVVHSRFDFKEMLRSIERYRINILFLVPPHVVLFSKHPAVKEYDLSSVRACNAGAAPISQELTGEFYRALPNARLCQGYGLTETSTSVSLATTTSYAGTPGSAGRLIPGTIAKIVKPDGTLAGYNDAGELWVKGPQNALCYLNNEKATKETFVDGWCRTGDEVTINEKGDIFVIDRIKEIFKVRGFQVAPAELEGHLLKHPYVADCAVVGMPDEFSGELPMAFVMLSEEAKSLVASSLEEVDRITASIKKHVSDAKVRYKWLEGGVEFVDAIPKNPSGKLLRRVLRDRAREISRTRDAGARARL